MAEIHEKVNLDPNFYNGIYFTEDGKAYVIGIIDSLTDYDFTKKGERALKAVRFGNVRTPAEDGEFPGVSCCPPDIYAARFKRFAEGRFLSVEA